jgi:hypothetical protein
VTRLVPASNDGTEQKVSLNVESGSDSSISKYKKYKNDETF